LESLAVRCGRATTILAMSASLSCSARHAPAVDVRPTADSVSRRIAVTEDLTIFTLFAWLNVVGYDLENRDAMHPVRIAIRSALMQRVAPDVRLHLRDFYRAHPSADPWSYAVVAKATSGPPDFTPTSAWAEISADKTFGDLAGLPELLQVFYREADVPSLYA